MNHKELLERLAADTGLTKSQARAAMDSLTALVTKTLKREGAIRLNGIGSFQVTKRGARKGRNPRTGEAIRIRASKSVRFKASQTLRASV